MLHPLRLRRLERGWCQFHLSWLTGVPQARISYAERGYPALTAAQQRLIGEALDVQIEVLFPQELARNRKAKGLPQEFESGGIRDGRDSG